MYVFRQYGTQQLRNLVVRVRSLWNGCECLRQQCHFHADLEVDNEEVNC